MKIARLLKFTLPVLITLFSVFVLTKPISADYIDDVSLADCYVDATQSSGTRPVVIQPGQSIELWLISHNSVTYSNFTMSAKNLNTGITRNIQFTSTAPATNTRINLGAYSDPGTYEVKATSRFSNDICVLNAAFLVRNQNSTLRLEEPVSPIATEIKTIPKLVISGLTAGHTYQVKLPNWKGHDLDNGSNSNSHDWLADSSGKITAVNICNNGNANRTNCGEVFGNQTYSLDVYENTTYIGSLAFDVTGEGSGTGLGANPCTRGSTGSCETALGNIPTNLKDFSTKLLSIATGIAGGIALILMVIGAIRVLMSSGDQQRLSGGRDMIVAAVAGLLFLIFSVLILKFIGINILGGVMGL